MNKPVVPTDESMNGIDRIAICLLVALGLSSIYEGGHLVAFAGPQGSV
jgi:hypothetical protein